MPTLQGIIADSVGRGVSGTLEIRLDSYRVDTSTTPDTVYYGKPARYQITGGDIATAKSIADDGTVAATVTTISLLTNNQETYSFSFRYPIQSKEYYLDGALYTGDRISMPGPTPAAGWYSGAVYNATVSKLLTEYTRSTLTDLFTTFSSRIPSGATVEWAVLTNSGINAANLDTSIYEVARIASNTFGGQIAASLFVPKGNYNAATSYPKFSTVFDTATKMLYWKISDNLTSGLSVTDTTHWMKILEAPASVAQTITLLDGAYAAAWDNNTTQAPTVNALYDALQRYAVLASTYTKTETDGKITAALAAFVPPAASTANDQAYSDSSTAIANTKFANALNRQYVNLVERRASNADGGAAATNVVTRVLNARTGGVAIGGVGSWCTELTGSGSVRLLAGRYKLRGFATANRVNGHRCYIFNVTANANLLDINNALVSGCAGFLGTNLGNTSAANGVSTIADTEFVLAADSYIQLRHYLANPGNISTDLGMPSGQSLGGEIYSGLTIEWLAAS